MQRRKTFRLIVATGAAVIMSLTASLATAQKADVQAGKEKYLQFCASCHGAAGKGDGPAAAALNPKPRDHSDAKYMATLKDEEVFNIIKQGGVPLGKSPLMPPWGQALSDQDIRNVVGFIRTLAKPGAK
ncbi:MAG: cytochrome c [Candidatus Tectomicrobia bacterium]|nr:cytochrome c [Candidatus Tectomicrobia bacterium]